MKSDISSPPGRGAGGLFPNAEIPAFRFQCEWQINLMGVIRCVTSIGPSGGFGSGIAEKSHGILWQN